MNTENISVFSVFLAGFLSVLTPPLLVIIPPYLAYLSGSSPLMSSTWTRKVIFLLYAVMFWGGFALLFVVLFGAPAEVSEGGLLTLSQILPILGGFVLILFAVYVAIRTFLWIFWKEKLAALLTSYLDVILTSINCLRSAFLGMIFAAGWTPVVGLILGSVLTMAIQGQNGGQVRFYLLVYTLGLAIPLAIIALLLLYLTHYLRSLYPVMGVVEQFVSALVLFVYGLLLLTGIFTYLNLSFNQLVPLWLIERL